MAKQPYPELEGILSLVDNIRKGKVALPEFQRNFVWSNQDIKDLLVSVLNGYFIGTFLFLRRGTSFKFKIRYFQGVNEANFRLPQEPIESNVDRIVLDGQQRLTTLFYVLYHPKDISPKGASYPYRYFLKIGERLKGKDWDGVIWAVSENNRVKNILINESGTKQKYSFKKLLDKNGDFSALITKAHFKEYLFENELIPFPNLVARTDLDDWLDDYGDYLREREGKDHDHIKNIKKKVREELSNWFDFKVPILTIEDRPLYEVAEIFERINRTGVELSVFALATAVFCKEEHNLRKWWKEYYENDDSIKKYCKEDEENFPKYILQIIALLQGKEVKKKVLIDPSELEIGENLWDEATKLLKKALQRLENTQTGYGVIKSDLLPYKPIIVTLSGLLKYCKSNDHFKKLDSWYWSSVFTGRYASSSDTIIKQDFDQVKDWLEDDSKIPDVVKEAKNKIEDLGLRKVTKGALYKAILNIIALHGAKDFFTGQSIELGILNDHHIFPKKSGIMLENENSILNRTLISDTTNKKISKKKPSQYLREMEYKLGSKDKVKATLKTHLISEKTFEALEKDDYEAFIRNREAEIKKEMEGRVRT